ncbi:discoidin domain-containing protein [Niabella hibiscisoli]|uniref:discoidin domain-containing protein n=1 Tax=Niabella hibiscisoli TaxID=1825928 RepID=UPI001F105771|nr:discoidin domain-containing protein [Niabella hibiscisoli]MCH5720662.1 discoidin domain-containing protein [Niabella hibiscisoli]
MDPKSLWTITTNSAQATGETAPSGPAAAAIDGNLATYWHSQYSPAAIALPYNLTVDMFIATNITALKFALRSALSRPVKRIRLETSLDGSSWTEVGGSPFTVPQVEGLQTFTLTNPVTARYFRVIIPSTADTDGTGNTSIAELDIVRQ